MARPLRVEFVGALYHVTARGDGREDIYRADGDRHVFLDLLADVRERFNWTIHAYCLMTNHYHLLVETPDANLSRGMRQLNGVYTQRFNRTYDHVGHVFQGHRKAMFAATCRGIHRSLPVPPGASADKAARREGRGLQYLTTGPFHDSCLGRARAMACAAEHQPSQALRPGRPRSTFSKPLHLA